MAKTRLNAADREAIGKKIIAHKFDPLQAENKALEYALAYEVWTRVYTPAQQKQMAAFPKGAFAMSTTIGAAVSGKRLSLSFSALEWEGGRPKDRATHPVFYSHSRGYGSEAYIVTDEDNLGARILARANREEELKEERSSMAGKLEATLRSFNTFDDLLAKFPEAQAFIMERWRDRPEGGSPSVPAVIIKDLAAQLDLPPETLAEAA